MSNIGSLGTPLQRSGARWNSTSFFSNFAAVILGLTLAFYVSADFRRINHGNRGDFVHFFYAAKALALHQDPYTAYEGGYIYPPLVAFLYRPLVGFSEVGAIRIMLVVNAGLIAAAVATLTLAYRRRLLGSALWPPLTLVMLLAVLLNLDKVRLEMQMWQTNCAVCLCFALALLWLDDMPILSGAALGFGCNIKYLTLPMVPYLLLRRRWKVLASFASAAVLFALLPALESGWRENLRNLSVAYGGLLRLMGLPGEGTQTANIESVKAFWSCSITTAAFRHRFPLPPMVMVIGVAMAFVASVMFIYRRRGLPLLLWPPANGQAAPPWNAATAIEWSGIIAFTLALSPQTNTAHLFLALAVTAPAAALLLCGRLARSQRMLLAAGMLAMLAAFSLPPGQFNYRPHAKFVMQWKQHGGPCWGLLGGYLILAWVALGTMRSAAPGGADARAGRATPAAADSADSASALA